MIYKTIIRFNYLPARKCEQIRKIALSNRAMGNLVSINKVEGFPMQSLPLTWKERVTVHLAHKGTPVPQELHLNNFKFVKTYEECHHVINLCEVHMHGEYIPDYQPGTVHKELESLRKMNTDLWNAFNETDQSKKAYFYLKQARGFMEASRILEKYIPKH